MDTPRQPPAPRREKPEMERRLENIIFQSRWLLAPLYLGLSLALTFLTFPLSSGEVGEEAVVRKVLSHQRYDVGLLGETLELTVKATNRDCYALGALAAAKFVAGKPPGLYSMYDVLGLS